MPYDVIGGVDTSLGGEFVGGDIMEMDYITIMMVCDFCVVKFLRRSV